MANIFCYKSIEKYIRSTVKVTNNEESDNDWTAHIVDDSIIVIHHSTLLNLVLDENQEFEKSFYNVLFSEINNHYILKEDEKDSIRNNIGEFKFFKKSNSKRVNSFTRNLSSLVKFSKVDESIIEFDNGFYNDDVINDFLKIFLR